MAQLTLTLGSIEKMERGMISEAFNQEVERVVKDISDRPGVDAPREVTMKVKIFPEQDENGVVTTGKIAFNFGSKMPARESREIAVLIGANGKDQLVFNPESIDNARQRTIDETIGNPEKDGKSKR